MCKLIKILIFHVKLIMFVSVYIALIFCGIKFEVNYLHKAAKLISDDKARFDVVLYSFKLCYYILKKLAANTC